MSLSVNVQNDYTEEPSVVSLAPNTVVSLPISDFLIFTAKGIFGNFQYRLSSASPWIDIQGAQPSPIIPATGPVQVQGTFAGVVNVVNYTYVNSTDSVGGGIPGVGQSSTAIDAIARAQAASAVSSSGTALSIANAASTAVGAATTAATNSSNAAATANQVANQALALAQAGGGTGGSLAVTRTADIDQLNLTRTVESGGTATPPVAGQVAHVMTDRTLTIGVGAVPRGFFTGDYALVGNLTFGTGIVLTGHTPVAGDQIHLEVMAISSSVALAVCAYIASLDVTKPVIASPNIVQVDPTHMSWVVSDAGGGVTLTGTIANVHVTKNGSAIAVTNLVFVSGVLYVTLPSAAAYGDVYVATLDAGIVTDGAGNAALASTNQTATNGVPLPAPAAPVVAGGTNGTTTLAGTIALGANSSAVDHYILFYKKTADSTYTGPITIPYAPGPTVPYSVSSLPADASQYQVEAYAVNSTATSPVSNVVTSSLMAVVTNVTDSFTGTDGIPITGKSTDTGGKVWLASQLQSSPNLIGNNTAQMNAAYQTGFNYYVAANYNGTISAQVYNPGIAIFGQWDDTNLSGTYMYWDYDGNVKVIRKYVVNDVNPVLASVPYSGGPATFAMTFTGGDDTPNCVATLNGTQIYNGNPRANDSSPASTGRSGQPGWGFRIFQGNLDNFVGPA